MNKEILVITTAFPRTENDVITPWLVKLMDELNKKGYHFTVFTSSYRAIKQKKFYNFKIYRFRYAPKNIEVLTHETSAYDKVKQGIVFKFLTINFLVAGFFNALYLSLSGKFKIIHTHWPIPHILFALPFKLLNKSKVICQYHGSEVGLLEKLPQLARGLFARLLNLADFSITNSTYNKKKLEKLGIKTPIEVIPLTNPHTTETIPYVEKHNKRVLFVGRLTESKGLTILLKAFKIIANKYPDSELVIVGDGPLRKNLENLAYELGIESKTIFKGFLTGEPLLNEYREAMVFVLPSIETKGGSSEGLGVVLLEALSMGIPVVGANIGGIPDIIINGETGLLAEPGNHQDLAEKIINLIESPDLRRTLTEKGQQHLKANFTWNKIVDKMDVVYKKFFT